jgi:NAD(P)H dehydrogenase (quinone)
MRFSATEPAILVTGAAGKTGQAVLRQLASRGVATRALVHRAAHEAVVRSAGATEVANGDLLDRESLRSAARAARAIYHICPNMHPREVEIGDAVIDAARRAGVRRVVYHSVLRPQIEAMPHHWRKLRVEERLWSSGLDVTVLQPAALMQNLQAHLPSMRSRGELPVPYSADAVFTLVDLGDVAQVAADVLEQHRHIGATYELCGGERRSHRDMAAVFAEVLARPVEAVVMGLEAWREKARGAGLDGQLLADLGAMFRYYDRHGFAAGAEVLRRLLGREPTTLRACVESWLHAEW